MAELTISQDIRPISDLKAPALANDSPRVTAA